MRALSMLPLPIEPGCFLLYEQYETYAALAAHRETPHFQAIIEREIVPMLEQREREFYSLVA